MGKLSIKPWMFVALLALVCIIAYSNTFSNEFVWDDELFVVENMHIREWENIPSFFTELVDGLYRPLRTLWYTVVFHIFGLNTFGYHLNSLLLHTIATFLAYGIISALTEKKTVGFLSALLFALHPMHTERVTGITAGFDLLGIVFMLSAFYLYILHAKANRHGSSLSIYILYILGILSNEEALALPLLIIAYHIAFGSHGIKSAFQRWKSYIPYAVILALYFAFRIFGFTGISRPVVGYVGGSFYITFINTLKVFALYPWLLIFPYPLILDRQTELYYSILSLPILVSILFLLFSLWLLYYFYKKDKIIFFGMAWFWITLLIFTNIFPTHTLMAERYLYIPSIGFCMILGYIAYNIYNASVKGINRISPLAWKSIIAIIFISILVAYSAITVQRNAEWKNTEVMWSKVMKQNPRSSSAYGYLAGIAEQKGDLKTAMAYFHKAIELNPQDDRTYTNLGVIYAKLGDYKKAEELIKQTIQRQPTYYIAYDLLALVYQRQNKVEDAVKIIGVGIKVYPNYYKFYNTLGIIYSKSGNLEESIKNFEKSIQINRHYANAYYNLGLVYLSVNQTSKAKELIKAASELEPDKKSYVDTYKSIS